MKREGEMIGFSFLFPSGFEFLKTKLVKVRPSIGLPISGGNRNVLV